MKDFNILDEAEAIAVQYALRRPDYINVPEVDWAVISDETKSLLIQVQTLVKPLEDAYLEAVRRSDWKQGLLLYQRMVSRPRLFGIDPGLYDECKYIEREIEFMIRAKVWINEVEELL